MRVLVTGATGFVGSHAVAGLIDAGHRVRVLARRPDKVGSVLAPHGVAVDDVVAGDMTDPGSVASALDGCEAVLHCAAEIGMTGGNGPAGTANVDGARLVIGGAVERGLDPVVYTSSVTVHLPTSAACLFPDSPLAEPVTSYGAQKRDVEVFVRGLQAQGAPVTTLVVGAVYGPVSPHLDGSFAALTAALGSGMFAPDSGMGVLDVRDLAAIICRVMQVGIGPRRYLVSGRYVTWKEWAALLQEASGRPVPYHLVGLDEMIALGRQFDAMRADGHDVPPLSEEAAIVMGTGCPGDDTATLDELGVGYRPLLDTFRDAVAWLDTEGYLSGSGAS